MIHFDWMMIPFSDLLFHLLDYLPERSFIQMMME